jgi:hypothetical protein
MPPPTKAPSGTCVLMLCGQPLQKYGVRLTDDRFGVQRPVCMQQGTTVLVEFAGDQRPVDTRVQRVLQHRLEGRILVLDDQDLGQSNSEATEEIVIDRRGHPQLQQSNAGCPDLFVRAQAEQRQRLPHLVIGMATRDQTDPRIGRVDGHDVEVVLRAVQPSQEQANLEHLLLEIERVRRQQTAVGVRYERAPSVFHVRNHRQHPMQPEVDRARAIGDGRSDLERRPQTTRAR